MEMEIIMKKKYCALFQKMDRFVFDAVALLFLFHFQNLILFSTM